MQTLSFSFLTLLINVFGCNTPKQKTPVLSNVVINRQYDTTMNTIHVFVALCDNKYQGIVPVPPKIGNGQDPANNLYWGCSYGIKNYFKKSPEWQLVKQLQPDSVVLERLIFKHKTQNWYLVADAYDGKKIKECTHDFLRSCSGQKKDVAEAGNKTMGISGNAKLLCYIGHNGLMDFKLTDDNTRVDSAERSAVILACISKNYFNSKLKQAGATPLLWSTGLMSPEAYTLHDAVNVYIKGGSNGQIRDAAAAAYSKYQNCSLKAAKNLLVTGW